MENGVVLRHIPRQLRTSGAHVDAKPDDPLAPVEVMTDHRGGVVRVMPAADAHALDKRRRRRAKRALKAAGTRHERRTARQRGEWSANDEHYEDA